MDRELFHGENYHCLNYDDFICDEKKRRKLGIFTSEDLK